MIGRLIIGIIRFIFGFTYAIIRGLWNGTQKGKR